MAEQDVRKQILMAAMAVFARKGFAKASMNDIVHESGLSKGGVYWHFKSKDELLKAIFDQFFEGQIAFLDAVLAREGSAGDRLLQLARRISTDLSAMADQFPSPLEFYALAARDDRLQQALQKYFGSYYKRLAALVEQGISTNEFRPVAVADTAQTLVSLFEGIILVWAVDPATVDLTHQLETAIQLLLTGLQAPSV